MWMKINRNSLYLAADALLLILIGLAWKSVGNASDTNLEIASLLGIVAFNFMWTHYMMDIVASRGKYAKRNWHYYLSRGVVLVALLAHPLIVNWYLFSNNFGLPPRSYEALLGALAWVVALGLVALLAFLSFEARKYFKKYSRIIHHANIAAMFLVLIHGFLIGMVMMKTWYVWVWWALLVGYIAITYISYSRYYATMPRRLNAAYGVVTIFAVASIMAGIFSMSSTHADRPKQPSRVSDNKRSMLSVTPQELAKNNGLNGAKCWVAVEGIVYDASHNGQWRNGIHIPSGGMAKCGYDLTSVIARSPHGKGVLSVLPSIGKLR